MRKKKFNSIEDLVKKYYIDKRESEKRLKTKVNDEIIIINKIYELEDNLDELGQVINDLKVDLREVIEKIYRDKESIKFIALESKKGSKILGPFFIFKNIMYSKGE